MEAQILINCLTRASCSNSTQEDVGKFSFRRKNLKFLIEIEERIMLIINLVF